MEFTFVYITLFGIFLRIRIFHDNLLQLRLLEILFRGRFFRRVFLRILLHRFQSVVLLAIRVGAADVEELVSLFPDI